MPVKKERFGRKRRKIWYE